VVEDEVEEFRDRADALENGLVHGQSHKWLCTGGRGDELRHVTHNCVTFSRVTTWISSAAVSADMHSVGTKYIGGTYGIDQRGIWNGGIEYLMGNGDQVGRNHTAQQLLCIVESCLSSRLYRNDKARWGRNRLPVKFTASLVGPSEGWLKN